MLSVRAPLRTLPPAPTALVLQVGGTRCRESQEPPDTGLATHGHGGRGEGGAAATHGHGEGTDMHGDDLHQGVHLG